MRTDAEIVQWVAALFDAGTSAETMTRYIDGLERLQGAQDCGLRGREMIVAAMEAIMLEPGDPIPMRSGVQRIADERQRVIEGECFSIEQDAQYNTDGQLARAAITYLLPPEFRRGVDYWRSHEMAGSLLYWPWPSEAMFKPGPTRIRELEKAGQLIAAEIDRLQFGLNLKPGPSDEAEVAHISDEAANGVPTCEICGAFHDPEIHQVPTFGGSFRNEKRRAHGCPVCAGEGCGNCAP